MSLKIHHTIWQRLKRRINNEDQKFKRAKWRAKRYVYYCCE